MQWQSSAMYLNEISENMNNLRRTQLLSEFSDQFSIYISACKVAPCLNFCSSYT